MLNIDLKNHPYEVKYNAMIKSAEAHHKLRQARPRPLPRMPVHCVVLFNREEELYGVFNARLNQWESRFFKEPQIAELWYRQQM